ncbi:PadR family transcriptional regulator [Krasilnikoviella flava]|uniref:Transcriptional regulator, PadR family n=1 Tax=Krasilnikoviella flava TaxID=526729 RepID=A0A1T5J2C4_9MICO|nr:PadR family transcriptional regulator [Krasilnikoviella flava]SKC45599.1 transcriptional regulator, PadR family [Krasilnikoviella flava]
MVPTRDAVLTQLRKGVVEYCVLACLRSGPAYGLELAERLGATSTLLTSEGTLYPLLSRLRQQGWVTTTQVASPVGPPRRYYELTAEGRAALETFTATWARFTEDVRTTLEPR